MEEERCRILRKLNEWNIDSIAKAFLGFCLLFLLSVVCVVGIFIPNISRTCLPNCGDSLVHISDVLENKYLQIKMEKKKIADKFFADNMAPYDSHRKRIPSAKLIGKEMQKLNTTGMVPIDTWCTGVELDKKGGFLQYDVRYYKGRLVVPVPGTYFVYSFVEFYEPCSYSDGTPKAENREGPIKHALFKYSVIGGENVEITGSAQPHKIAKNKFENVYSSYISTVVDLKAGDELSVQVNNVSLLSKYAGDNYFGLVLIE